MMKTGLSALRDKLRGFHTTINCICQCVVCIGEEQGTSFHAHDQIFKYITLMWESCLCPKGEYERWHRL